MSRKKKLLHHAATADVIEAQGEIVEGDVKSHDLLATVSLVKTGLNVTVVDHVKTAHLVKNGGHAKNGLSGLHENQRARNVQLAALLRGIVVKVPRRPVTAVIHEHLASLRSSQTSLRGKKQSVLCL